MPGPPGLSPTRLHAVINVWPKECATEIHANTPVDGSGPSREISRGGGARRTDAESCTTDTANRPLRKWKPLHWWTITEPSCLISGVTCIAWQHSLPDFTACVENAHHSCTLMRRSWKPTVTPIQVLSPFHLHSRLSMINLKSESMSRVSKDW